MVFTQRIRNIITHLNGKVGSLLGWKLQKILILLKSVSNKNFEELNFLQKIQRVHIFISPRWVIRDLQKLPIVKYYTV